MRQRISSILAIMFCAMVMGVSPCVWAGEAVTAEALREIVQDDALTIEQKRKKLRSLSGGAGQKWSLALLDEDAVAVAVECLRSGSPELAEDFVGWLVPSLDYNQYRTEDVLYEIVEDKSVPPANRVAILDATLASLEGLSETERRFAYWPLLRGVRARRVKLSMLMPNNDADEIVALLRSKSLSDYDLGHISKAVVVLLRHSDARVRSSALNYITKDGNVGQYASGEAVLLQIRIVFELSCFWEHEGRDLAQGDVIMRRITGIKPRADVPPKDFWTNWWQNEGQALFLAPNSKHLREAQRRMAEGFPPLHWLPVCVVEDFLAVFDLNDPEMTRGVDSYLQCIIEGVERPKNIPPEKFWPDWWKANKEDVIDVIGDPFAELADESTPMEQRWRAAMALRRSHMFARSEQERIAIRKALWNVLQSKSSDKKLKERAVWTLSGLAEEGAILGDTGPLVRMALDSLKDKEPKLDKGLMIYCLANVGKPSENEEVREALLAIFRDDRQPLKLRRRALSALSADIRNDKKLLLEILEFAREQCAKDGKPLRYECDENRAMRLITGRMYTRYWGLEDWEKYINSLPDDAEE